VKRASENFQIAHNHSRQNNLSRPTDARASRNDGGKNHYKGDITQHHVGIQAMRWWEISPFNDFCGETAVYP